MWYNKKIIREALRKHNLRVDIHVHAGEEEEYDTLNDIVFIIKGILTAAISKGLDVVGIVSHQGPYVGQKAQQFAIQENIDIFVIPGEEYLTNDNVRLNVYLLKDKLPLNLSAEQVCEYAHNNKGFVLGVNLTKRNMQKFNKLKGTNKGLDAVEIYNNVIGAYVDVNTDYPKFVSSAAKSIQELENANVFTLVNRNILEGMGLLPENYGVEFVPNYLKNV